MTSGVPGRHPAGPGDESGPDDGETLAGAT